MKSKIVIISLVFVISTSCGIYFKESRDLHRDSMVLNNNDFAKKYYTIYRENEGGALEGNSLYISLRNEFYIFSKNNYVYKGYSNPSISKLEVIFKRRAYYVITDSIIKIETIAQSSGSVYSIIEEGYINGDTIEFMQQYTGRERGRKNIHDIWIRNHCCPVNRNIINFSYSMY
jgi:hypothetical protein